MLKKKNWLMGHNRLLIRNFLHRQYKYWWRISNRVLCACYIWECRVKLVQVCVKHRAESVRVTLSYLDGRWACPWRWFCRWWGRWHPRRAGEVDHPSHPWPRLGRLTGGARACHPSPTPRLLTESASGAWAGERERERPNFSFKLLIKNI